MTAIKLRGGQWFRKDRAFSEFASWLPPDADCGLLTSPKRDVGYVDIRIWVAGLLALFDKVLWGERMKKGLLF